MFKESITERVAPRTTGFNSIQGKYKPQEGSFLGRFEPGHQDSLCYGSLGQAIDVIHQIGIHTIEEGIEEINHIARETFADKGFISSELADRTSHGAFYNIKGDQSLVARLRDQDILVMPRGKGMRVSFNYYNTQEDLNRLLDVL